MSVLDEEYARSRVRDDLLRQLRDQIDRLGRCEMADGFETLRLLVELLSESEKRVMHLHAHCVAMLEHAGKVLDLDARLRPVLIKFEAPPPPKEEG